MKETIIIYTIESISVLQKLSRIYLHLVHWKGKQNNNDKKEGMLRKAKHYWALPHTGRLTLVLGIQRGVCLRHHKIVADRNSALFDQQTIVCQQINTWYTQHTKKIETLKTVTWLSKIKMSLQGLGKHCISGTAGLVMSDLTSLSVRIHSLQYTHTLFVPNFKQCT